MSFTAEPTGLPLVGAALARDLAGGDLEHDRVRRLDRRRAVARERGGGGDQHRARRPPATAAGIRATVAHWRSLILCPTWIVCGSRSGFSRRMSSSGTPVFSAIDDGVSPTLTR